MIQRTLLRQSRVVGACIRSTPRTALVRPQFRIADVSRQIASSRSYATEPELKKAAEGEAAIGGKEASETAQSEDPTKKELEAKNKEIVELKVCHQSSSARLQAHRVLTKVGADVKNYRTNTSDQSPSSETFRSAPSVTCKARKISQSRSLQRTSWRVSTTSTVH